MGDEDKKHDPTGHKLDEERKKGNILKVQDVMTTIVILVSAYVLSAWLKTGFGYLFKYWVETLETVPQYVNLTFTQVLQALARAAVVIVIVVGPFIIAIVLTVMIVMYAQVGWLITFKPLEPKFEKIDPIKGFKNKINPFKMKQLFNLTKTFLLMGAIGWMIYTTVRDRFGLILSSIDTMSLGERVPVINYVGIDEAHAHAGGGPGGMAIALIGMLAFELAKKIGLLMIVVAFVSYMFERWQWWKGMKMSDKEIKDEYKKLEGDPHIKGKQKQKMYEMAMGAAREAVPNADVIVTNPTHYSVALEYKPHRGMKSPIVIAKGRNHMALVIRQIAEENFIPMVEDPPTARALYAQVKIGQTIPNELFVAVAKIIASIMRKRQRPTLIPAQPPVLTNYQPIEIEPGPVIPGNTVLPEAGPAPDEADGRDM
ncbi:MAG: flagellar biosynthesis protein FlhB [Cyanobacteria bacterium RYN_339]|nr:flagellar biosynthesis protein FlhB [Cyanobacteria bacterium RYN_339]